MAKYPKLDGINRRDPRRSTDPWIRSLFCQKWAIAESVEEIAPGRVVYFWTITQTFRSNNPTHDLRVLTLTNEGHYALSTVCKGTIYLTDDERKGVWDAIEGMIAEGIDMYRALGIIDQQTTDAYESPTYPADSPIMDWYFEH